MRWCLRVRLRVGLRGIRLRACLSRVCCSRLLRIGAWWRSVPLGRGLLRVSVRSGLLRAVCRCTRRLLGTIGALRISWGRRYIGSSRRRWRVALVPRR